MWNRIAATLQHDADLEDIFIDSVIIRAHHHAFGAQKNAGSQAIGCLRGRPTIKIHACVDTLGNPLPLSSLRSRWRTEVGRGFRIPDEAS